MQIIRPTTKPLSAGNSRFGDYAEWRDIAHSGDDFGCNLENFVAPEDLKINEVTATTVQGVGLNSYDTNEGVKISFVHRFYHLNNPSQSLKDRTFKQGEVITKSGNENGEVDPHLHWTVIVNWTGNTPLCSPVDLSDIGKIIMTDKETGLNSWAKYSYSLKKGPRVPLKTKFTLVGATNMFDFKLTLSGKVTTLEITSGSCNADATVKNLGSGWSGTVHVNGGVGHTAVMNSDTGESLYEVSLNGATHQLDNRLVVDYKVQLDILQGRFDALYKESGEKDTQISSLKGSITNYISQVGALQQQVDQQNTSYAELDGQFTSYRTQSGIDKKNLEESLRKEKDNFTILSESKDRLQKEFDDYKLTSEQGNFLSAIIKAIRALFEWIKGISNKKDISV